MLENPDFSKDRVMKLEKLEKLLEQLEENGMLLNEELENIEKDLG